MNTGQTPINWRGNGASEALQSNSSDTIKSSQNHSNSTLYLPAGSRTGTGGSMSWNALGSQKVNAMPLQATSQSQNLTPESSHRSSETEDCAMEIERPLNTKKQLAKLCSTHEIWDLSDGDFFIIAASSGDVYATLTPSVYVPDNCPLSTLDSGYNGAWVFRDGNDIPKDIISASSVLVSQAVWLHWQTVTAIKQLGALTFHFLISGDGRDGQGRIRPVFRYVTKPDSVLTICAILNEARMGFSVTQVWAIFRPTSAASMNELKQVQSMCKNFKIGRSDKGHVVIF